MGWGGELGGVGGGAGGESGIGRAGGKGQRRTMFVIPVNTANFTELTRDRLISLAEKYTKFILR